MLFLAEVRDSMYGGIANLMASSASLSQAANVFSGRLATFYSISLISEQLALLAGAGPYTADAIGGAGGLGAILLPGLISSGIKFLANNGLLGELQAKFVNPNIEVSPNVDSVFKQIKDWLGPGTRHIVNKQGDHVFISADGTKKVRFDFNRPYPHNNPHMHLEIKVNGDWVALDPSVPQLYPSDVPHN